MKRVFISILVFAITSTANAAFQIMVNGDKNAPSTTCYIGDHFSLGIWTDTDVLQNEGVTFALVVDQRMAYIDYTTGVVVPPYDTDPGIFLEHSMSAAEAGFPLPQYEDGIAGYIAPINLPVINTSSILFDDIDYQHISTDVAVIKLYVTADWETITLVDTSVIMEIPEPMTIGLFGLGALFLRKRK